MKLKLAIIKNDIDLLRLTPIFKKKYIEFKISLLGNLYQIEYWKKGLNLSDNYKACNEITYHKSKNPLLPGIIQSKEIKDGIIDHKYQFPKVVDISINSEFPIPVLKLVYHNNFDRVYIPKKYHKQLDLQNNNTLEIYFISKEYDFVKFMNKWRFIDLLWNITTIDYVIDKVKLSKQFLNKLESKENSILKRMTDFGEFKLIFRFYSTEEIINKLFFYENYDYIHMLANTPICLADDETKKITTGVAPAFAFDLDYQLNDGADISSLENYEKIFASSSERIKIENCNKEIFVIPQVKENK